MKVFKKVFYILRGGKLKIRVKNLSVEVFGGEFGPFWWNYTNFPLGTPEEDIEKFAKELLEKEEQGNDH